MGFYGIDNPNPVTPQFAFPRRGGVSLSGTCIIHTAESALDVIGDDSGAEDVAAFCMRRADYGCYHSIVDSNSIVEIYPYEYETWQDSETNNWAVGISAACRTSDWRSMAPDISEGFYRNLAICAADFIVYMRDTYDINVPLRRISGQEARNRVPGFCAHGDSGISRTDPGADFDWDRFFRYTEEQLNGTTPKPEEDEKMLVIAKQIGSDAVYIGDGVYRRHITSVDILNDLRWCAANGLMKIWNNGEIAEFHRIDVIGRDLGASVDTLVSGNQSQVSWDGKPNPFTNVIKGMRTDVHGIAVGEVPVTIDSKQLTELVTSIVSALTPPSVPTKE